MDFIFMNHTIQNNYIKATISAHGAELKSLIKQDTKIEYIWQGDEKYWKRSSPVLFPIVGKLKNDKYIYDNKTYSMSQHGFARDLEFEVLKQTKDSINFTLSSNKHTYINYPFHFKLEIQYLLKNAKLEITYQVTNTDSKEILFSIGAHPAFNWPLVDDKKEDYYFLFEDIKKTQRYYLQDGLINNSEPLKIQNNKLFINENFFQKDALVFHDPQIQNISLHSTKHNHFIKLNFKDFTYLGLWSKPTGAPFVCIEPWCGIADKTNSNQKLEEKEGIIKLPKEKSFINIFSIEI